MGAAALRPGRSLSGTIIASLLVATAAFCAIVVAVELRLLSPQPATIGAAPAGLGHVEAVTFPSGSGSVLHGWWSAGRPGAGVVVLLPDLWSTRVAMVRRAHALSRIGAGVLLFDFQAEGESPGDRITFGALESRDAAAAVAFAQEKAPGEPIGVIGVSLGGAAAVLGARPLPVQALVLESVDPTSRSDLRRRLRLELGPVAGPLLSPVLAPVLDLMLPTVLHTASNDLLPLEHVASATAAVLIATGTEDRLVTIAKARALFERAPGPKQFWPVHGAGHVDLESHDPEEYWSVVLPFLSRSMKTDWGQEVRTAREDSRED